MPDDNIKLDWISQVLLSIWLSRLLPAAAILGAIVAPFWPRLALCSLALGVCSLAITTQLTSIGISWIYQALMNFRFRPADEPTGENGTAAQRLN